MHPLLAASLSLLALTALAAPHRAVDGGGGVGGTVTTEVKLSLKGAVSQRDLVLWLEPKAKGDAPKPVAAKVTQKKLNFEPHVLPVVKGSAVEFANEDQVKHNVFVDTACCKLDVDTDKGESKTHVFDQTGEYPIVCRLHPEMAMVVLVLESPWFVRVELQKDKDRSTEGKTVCTATFQIDGVPAGTYTLRTWNKKLKALEREVVVTDGKTEKLDLVLEK